MRYNKSCHTKGGCFINGIIATAYRCTQQHHTQDRLHRYRDAYEIYQTWNKTESIVLRDKIHYTSRGDICLLRLADLHSAGPKSNQPQEYSSIIVSATFLNDLLAQMQAIGIAEEVFLQKGGMHFSLNREFAYRADKLFAEIQTIEQSADPLKEFRKNMVLLRLLDFLLRNRSNPTRSAEDKIGDILEYINNRLTEKLTIDQISEQVYMDKFYLCHYFKKHTGLTLSAYITQRRISVAKNLLLRKNQLPVSRIAELSGFPNASYFSQVFKKSEGMAPAEFRKQNTSL